MPSAGETSVIPSELLALSMMSTYKSHSAKTITNWCSYRFVNASKVRSVSCRMYDCKRKHEHTLSTNDKFFVCPNPTFVESFLKDTIGFEAHIEADDLLCFRCYKYVTSVTSVHCQMKTYL